MDLVTQQPHGLSIHSALFADTQRARTSSHAKRRDYGSEIWYLYQTEDLHPRQADRYFEQSVEGANVGSAMSVMSVIDLVLSKEATWRRYKQEARR